MCLRGKNSKACREDGIKDSYITSNYTNKKQAENDKSYVDKLLQEKSSIKPGLELMHSVPMPISSKRLLSKEKKVIFTFFFLAPDKISFYLLVKQVKHIFYSYRN